MAEEEGQQKSRKVIINEWIILIAFLMIFIGGSIISSYFIINKINKCTSNPAKYLVQEMMEQKNVSYSNARILFYLEDTDLFASETVDIELKKTKISLP